MGIYKNVFLILALLLTGFPQAFGAAVEAVQLIHVPLEPSLRCDRPFFQSSQNSKTTIYAHPRVIPDTDIHGEHIVKIGPNPNPVEKKVHLLTFKLYFPKSEEEVLLKAHADVAGNIDTCNFEAIKRYLNDKGYGVETVTNDMPVAAIDVMVPDLIVAGVRLDSRNEEPKMIDAAGNETPMSDLTVYAGKSVTFSIPMTDNEKAGVNAALQDGFGLPVKVFFHFKSRQSDGKVSVTVDTQTLGAKFIANANGEKFVLKANLDLDIRAALAKTSISGEIIASTNDAFNTIAEDIITKVVAQININPDMNVTPDKPASDGCKAEGDKICVSVVAAFLANQITQNYNFSRSSLPEQTKTDETVTLKSKLLDPNLEQLRIAAGEGEPTLNYPIYKGQTVRLIPAFESLIQYDWIEEVTYLEKSDIHNPRYSKVFAPLLVGAGYKFDQDNENDTYYVMSGIPSWELFNMTTWWDSMVWQRIMRHQEVAGAPPRVKMSSTLSEYSRFPIFVTFSEVGLERQRFALADLDTSDEEAEGKPNPNFTGHYDEASGEMVVTAKKDLGLMKLRERFLLWKNNDASEKEEDEARHAKDELQRQKEIADGMGEKERAAAEAERARIEEESWNFNRKDIPIEEVLPVELGWWWGNYREAGEPIKIRSHNKATVTQQVVYYNVSRPHYEDKDGNQITQEQWMALPENSLDIPAGDQDLNNTGVITAPN